MQTSSLGFSSLPRSRPAPSQSEAEHERYSSVASSKESSARFSSLLKNLQALIPLQEEPFKEEPWRLKTPHTVSVALSRQQRPLGCSAAQHQQEGAAEPCSAKGQRGKSPGGGIALSTQEKVWRALFFSSRPWRTRSGLSSHSNGDATAVRRKRTCFALQGCNIQRN